MNHQSNSHRSMLLFGAVLGSLLCVSGCGISQEEKQKIAAYESMKDDPARFRSFVVGLSELEKNKLLSGENISLGLSDIETETQLLESMKPEVEIYKHNLETERIAREEQLKTQKEEDEKEAKIRNAKCKDWELMRKTCKDLEKFLGDDFERCLDKAKDEFTELNGICY